GKGGGEAERIRVEAWAAADDHVTRAERDEGSGIKAVAVEGVALQVHGPLRRSRAARGMQPEGGVLGRGRYRLQPCRRAVHQLVEIVLPGVGGPVADQDHMPQEWKVAAALPEARPER